MYIRRTCMRTRRVHAHWNRVAFIFFIAPSLSLVNIERQRAADRVAPIVYGIGLFTETNSIFFDTAWRRERDSARRSASQNSYIQTYKQIIQTYNVCKYVEINLSPWVLITVFEAEFMRLTEGKDKAITGRTSLPRENGSKVAEFFGVKRRCQRVAGNDVERNKYATEISLIMRKARPTVMDSGRSIHASECSSIFVVERHFVG